MVEPVVTKLPAQIAKEGDTLDLSYFSLAAVSPPHTSL